MREVVHGAGERAEEFLVAAFQRAEMRREAEVPFADQRRRIARVAQQRRQRRVRRRQG